MVGNWIIYVRFFENIINNIISQLHDENQQNMNSEKLHSLTIAIAFTRYFVENPSPHKSIMQIEWNNFPITIYMKSVVVASVSHLISRPFCQNSIRDCTARDGVDDDTLPPPVIIILLFVNLDVVKFKLLFRRHQPAS